MAKRKPAPIRFTGQCECPQCGCGSKDLKPEALPIVMNRFGAAVRLRCDICGGEWLQTVKEKQ